MDWKRMVISSCLPLLFQGCSTSSEEWKIALLADSVPAYKAFLKENPESEYSPKAKERIKEIRWESITQENSQDGYEEFIQNYPDDPRSREAISKLETLQWKTAQELGTREAYQEYLQNYPHGTQAAAAQTKIEDLDWSKAKNLNTYTSYMKYVNEHPNSQFLDEAHRLANAVSTGALRTATAQGDVPTVQAMLDMNINVNEKTENGTTPLMWGAMKGHADVVDLLLSRGAQINEQTEEGITALMLASQQGHLPIVERLLEQGADLTLQAKTGDTAMDMAARQQQIEALHTLIDEAIPKSLNPNSSKTHEPPWTKALIVGIEQVVRETLPDLTKDKELDINIMRLSNYDSQQQHYLVFANVALLQNGARQQMPFIRHFRLHPVSEESWKLEIITTSFVQQAKDPKVIQ